METHSLSPERAATGIVAGVLAKLEESGKP